MGKFEAGNDPAGHTVAEVVEFLKGDDVTGDEYDRVMQAERERDGGGRVGIISLSGVETPPPVDEVVEEPTVDEPIDEVVEDDEPPVVERPKTQTPEQAVALAIELNRQRKAAFGGVPAAEEADDDN